MQANSFGAKAVKDDVESPVERLELLNGLDHSVPNAKG